MIPDVTMQVPSQAGNFYLKKINVAGMELRNNCCEAGWVGVKNLVGVYKY